MEIDNKEYKEVKIKKMVVDGEEQEGNIIYAETTKNKQELHVTIYTKGEDLQEVTEVITEDVAAKTINEIAAQETSEQKNDKAEMKVRKPDTDLHKGRGRKIIDELLQKSIFRNRRG